MHLLVFLAVIDWTNPWLVGIGTAIISGIAVNLISRFVLTKKDDKEYRQKTASANNEILYALRPSVAEGEMPTKSIIESLIKATASKYGLKRNSLMNQRELADNLIKEVMDSSFISHQQKIKYCTEINKITKTNVQARSAHVNSRLNDVYYEYRRRTRQYMINALTVSSAILALISVVFVVDNSTKSILNDISPIILISALTPALLFILFKEVTTIFRSNDRWRVPRHKK